MLSKLSRAGWFSARFARQSRNLTTRRLEPQLTTLENGFRVVSEPISEGYSTATVNDFNV